MNNFSALGLLLSVSLNVMACTPHDEQYYRIHPKALQEAVAECPGKAPKLLNCDELHNIAIKVNELVYELRMSPQGYGKSILALQETIASQELAHQPDIKPMLDKNKLELRERLAIVNWLESPVS